MEPKDVDKRPHYFPGQYLLEDDFELEQDYHNDRQRRHNRLLHVSGIADGLIVTPGSDLTVTISAGTAIDKNGQQIVWSADMAKLPVNLQDINKEIPNGNYILSIGYVEDNTKLTDLQEGTTDGYRRWYEKPNFNLVPDRPPLPDDFIALAKLKIDGKTVTIDDSDKNVRQYSGLRLPSPDRVNAPTLRSGGDRTSNLAVLSGSLSVQGSLNVTGNLSVSGTGNSSFAGNVGIGMTTPPSEKLDVSGNIKATGLSVTGNVGIGIGTTTPKIHLAIGDDDTGLKQQGDNQLAIYTNFQERVRIDATGNVGIGTTSPSEKLEVAGNIKATGLSVTGNVGIGIGTTTPKIHLAIGDDDTGLKQQGDGQLAIYTNFQERVRIDATGNVGIGTTTPNNKLEIAGTSGDVLSAGVPLKREDRNALGGFIRTSSTANIDLSGHIQLKEYADEKVAYLQARDDRFNRDIGLQIRTQQQSSLIDALRIAPNGNVGIGTITPQANLHVNGRIKDKTGWVMPVGSILPYAATAAPAPEGWLLCNGNSLDSTAYAELFNIIGFQYGGSANKFNLPNLQGRVPVGLSTEEEFNVLAKVGGAKTHLLKESEMPSHAHGVNDPGHNHAIYPGDSGGTGRCDDATGSGRPNAYTATALTQISIQNTGGGQAHNNLQPYITINYIIKY